MSLISNARMAAYIDLIERQASEALHERADDILAAWHEQLAEAQDNEEKTTPPIKVGISATVDIEKNKIETVLKFTVTRSTKLSSPIPDPDQLEIPNL